MPKLLPEWRAIVKRAWSVRLNAAAIVFSGLEITWPMLDGYVPIPPRTFAVLAGVFGAAALAARIVAQKNMSGGRDEKEQA